MGSKQCTNDGLSCNLGAHDLPDTYALRLWAYISGKSLVLMLQLLHTRNYNRMALETAVINPHPWLNLMFKRMSMLFVCVCMSLCL